MKLLNIHMRLLGGFVTVFLVGSIFSQIIHQKTGGDVSFLSEKTGIIPPEKESWKLPSNALVFTEFPEDYQSKILQSGKIEILDEKDVLDWAKGQGFLTSKDSLSGGYYSKRAAIIYPPGIKFFLQIPKNDYDLQFDRVGWYLHLDISIPRLDKNKRFLTTSYRRYQNILRYHIYINDLFYKTIEVGYGKTTQTPIIFSIPFVREKTGKVSIEIKLANRPKQFLMLYDAFLSQNKK